jgi:hypothetical protein
MQDEHETPVVFRKYGPRRGDDVIALFPAEPGTYDPHTCSSYVHIGQHGSADPLLVIKRTRPAKPDEYADLKAELEGAPNLNHPDCFLAGHSGHPIGWCPASPANLRDKTSFVPQMSRKSRKLINRRFTACAFFNYAYIAKLDQGF